MQGKPRVEQELLDAEAIVGDLVKPGSVFAFLAAHRREVFDDSFTADLFGSTTGRPSLPADLVGSVLVLQHLYDLSDPRTAEALCYDLRWKVACGRALTDTSFHPTTLVYWRKRIAASAHPDRLFDKICEIITATGILKGRRKRCVDSTIVADAVATQDTVTQLVAAIRKVARLVPAAATAITTVCQRDYTQPGKPDIDWDDPHAKQLLVSALVNDALALLEHLTAPGSPDYDTPAADALGLLALIAGQDVEPADGSDGTDGRWRIARRVAPDRIISVVDPQARHARKCRSVRRDGYRVHLANEPTTGLITDAETTMATGTDNTDAATGVRMINRDRFRQPSTPPTDTPTTQDTTNQADNDTEPTTGEPEPAASEATEATEPTPGDDTLPAATGPEPHTDGDTPGEGLEVYGDSAYGSGEARAAYRDGGHDAIIKPGPLRPAVPGGFTVDDFTVDEDDATVTCPAGHTRPMSPTRTVAFGRLCSDCPLRERCTTSKTGRSMTIHEYDTLLRAARDQATTDAFRQAYPTRSNIERTVAHVATQDGRRVKLRYRGVAANTAWLRDRVAALNLRTLLGLGLTRTAGAWAIA